ncbi:MAG: hypothetical protein ACI4MJ_00695 [Aristaeellaceae bacterium]
MKYAAIAAALLLIVSLVGVGCLYLTANVTVEAVGVVAVEAATQAEVFSTLKEQQRTGQVVGTAFTSEPLGDAADYQFYTYTVRLKNSCFLSADMVELQVTPMTGDVLQIGDTSAKALAPRTMGDLQATILTDIGMHAIRELNVTYYMWGIPFTLRTTYGH